MADGKLSIRVATPDDHDLLAVLIRASYETLGGGAYDPVMLAAAMPVMSRPNPALLASGTYYIAELDGRSAASGGWTREKPGTTEIEPGVAHLRHFATDPAFARRGAAGALLRHCMAKAGAAGMTRMASQSTLPAEPFYASAGFRRVRIIDAEMGGGITLPVVLMVRSLP